MFVYQGYFPLHRALLPVSESSSSQKGTACDWHVIKSLAESYPDACAIRDPNGNFPVHLVVQNDIPEVLGLIVENGGNINIPNVESNILPFDEPSLKRHKEDFIVRFKDNLSEKALSANGYALWKKIIQFNPIEIRTIESIVEFLIQRYPELLYAKFDDDGHSTWTLANPKIKAVMKSTIFWFKKYELAETQPIHTSATCFVYKALLRHDNPLRRGDNPVETVALKLMGNKEQFFRELQARKIEFGEEYIVKHIDWYPKDDALMTKDNVEDFGAWGMSGIPLTKVQAEQCFCLVMPMASRNLFVSLKQDRFAGQKDLDYVRNIFSKIIDCVEHLHNSGLIHGDLKPLNLVKMNNNRYDWRLIDLDASCAIGIDYVGFKSSSAYMPPEAILDTTTLATEGDSQPSHRYVPKGHQFLNNTLFERFLLLADPSYDIWSLGCILYQLCHPDVMPLFNATRDDNLSSNLEDEDNLRALHEWTNITKMKKLMQIKNKYAHNLIMQMLNKDPSKRPTLQSIRQHPFITNKLTVARLHGDKAEVSTVFFYNHDRYNKLY
jgi:serine/threonine protein kinase